jgi:uncharacterized protein YegP (UPF0339 family)
MTEPNSQTVAAETDLDPLDGEEPNAVERDAEGLAFDRQKQPGDAGARIEIVKDDEHYYWAFFSGNGRVVATCPSGYEKLDHLKTTLQSIRDNFPTAPILRNY